MNEEKTSNLLEDLYTILHNFKSVSTLTPAEYAEQKYSSKDPYSLTVVEHFLQYTKYELLLTEIAHDIISKYSIRMLNIVRMQTMLYLLMFYLEEENYADIIPMLVSLPYGLEMVSYLTEEENQIIIAGTSCKLFDNEYVLDNIMYPLLNKMFIIQRLIDNIKENRSHKTNKPTFPEELQVLSRIKKVSAPPPNTPLLRYVFKASKIPKSTFKSNKKIQKALEEKHYQNKLKAEKLMLLANEKIVKLAQPKFIQEPETGPIPIEPFKAKKPSIQKHVEVRGNLTSTLRQANIYIKEQENAIKNIEDLMKGGVCRENLEQMEADKRKQEEEWHLENIQKKHLQGLLTYEEAILAKRNLEISNQEKTAKYKEEKLKILEGLEKWREDEQEKIKSIVNKIQDIHKAARDAEKKMQEDKQCSARLLQFESKQLLKKYYEDKQKELEKKMDLIQEIRAMEQVRNSINIKEFDPTESPNFGLLCEMSIAELQERLVLTNIKMKQDLEEKRKQIQKRKEDQELMVDNIKNFIEQAKQCQKIKLVPKVSTVKDSPEILALRKELEMKRSIRKKL